MEGLFYIAVCVAVGYFAKSKGRSAWGWGIGALFISPVIAAVILFFLKDLNKAAGGKAPTPVVPPVKPQAEPPRPQEIPEAKPTAPRKAEVEEDIDSIFEKLESDQPKPAAPPEVKEEPIAPPPVELEAKEAAPETEVKAASEQPAVEPAEVIEQAETPQEPAAATEQQAAVDEPVVVAPKAAFCTNCGNKLEGAPKFCTNCGAPVA